MARLVAPDGGVRGVDVNTERGTKSYNVEKNGTITVDNPAHARQMVSEGFFHAADFSGLVAKGFPCSCGFNAVFRVCGKCGKDNG